MRAAMVRTSVEMFKRRPDQQGKGAAAGRSCHARTAAGAATVADFKGKPLATGLPASPGAASGKIVFDADTAELRGRNGERIILVREETKPEDIHGFFQAQGILTSRGGKTSHAAVVARGMGKPCVSGCEAIHIDDIKRCATIGETTLHEGDVVTIDGGNGKVYAGEVPTVQAEFNRGHGDPAEVGRPGCTPEGDGQRRHARGCRQGARLRRHGHRPVPHRAHVQRHRPPAHRAGDDPRRIREERQAALDRLLPIQRADFKGIFKAMKGLPVTVRLMDPPLHEFLPTAAQLELEIAHLHHLRDSLEGGGGTCRRP
jgi:pyruvate,orthophosphate dikinase